MALNAATVWEVRTTGNANNGGGFYAARDAVNGVDYSQQDAAQLSLTDGYRVAASTLYSDTGGFTHAMEGNLIYIASGTHFTAGYYEIVTYTSSNQVTLDRDSASEDTSAHKDAVFSVGGASNHPNTIATSVIAGNTIYIASGTYVKVGANAYVLQLGVSGSSGNAIKWIGYITTRSSGASGTDRPTFDGNSDTTNCLTFNSKNRNIFENIWFKRATGANITGDCSGAARFHNCKSSNAGSNGFNMQGGSSRVITLFDCEIDNNGDKGFYLAQNNPYLRLYFCYIHDNTNGGVENPNSPLIDSIFSIIESNSGVGIMYGSSVNIIRNVFYNNTGASSDGINFDSLDTTTIAVNNISVSNGRYGFRNSAGNSPYIKFDYNLYNGNGTAGLSNVTAGAHDVTSAVSFTDAANGDFSLAAGSPAIDTGFPGSSMAGATV